MAYDEIPGISMAIVYEDKIIWNHAMGYSDLEKKTPMTTNTIYSICSISKLFTSIAIMQLLQILVMFFFKKLREKD